MSIVTFEYMNHRGEKEMRCVAITSLAFIPNPRWGYQPGWFLTGVDQDRKQIRSFALSRIIIPEDTLDGHHASNLPIIHFTF